MKAKGGVLTKKIKEKNNKNDHKNGISVWDRLSWDMEKSPVYHNWTDLSNTILLTAM